MNQTASLAGELKHLVARLGAREWVGFGLAALLFAYVVPARYGLDFLDVYFLLAYACLPSLFVSPMVADSILGWRPSEETAKADAGALYRWQVLAAALFALTWGLVVVLGGIVVANMGSRIGRLVFPPAVVFTDAMLFSAALTLFSAAAVGWLALNSKTAAEAKGNVRRLFLLVLLSIVMWVRMGPQGTKRSLDRALMNDRISMTLLPVVAVCLLVAVLAIRAGTGRKAEEAAGPLFKL